MYALALQLLQAQTITQQLAGQVDQLAAELQLLAPTDGHPDRLFAQLRAMATATQAQRCCGHLQDQLQWLDEQLRTLNASATPLN